MTGRAQREQAHDEGTSTVDPTSASAIDLALVLAVLAADVGAALGHRATQVTVPVLRPLWQAPLRGTRAPPTWLADLARRGRDRRAALRDQLSRLTDLIVPGVVGQILDRLDLTAIVRERVDLDAVVSSVDLDEAAARLDLDVLAARLNAAAVVESMDLNAIASRLDVDAVARRIDVDALLDRLDLNRIVRERIDVDGVVRTVDLDAIVARIDLVGLAREIIDAIDLPEIIRESTGSMASETVHGMRMRGVAGDDAVGRAIDRLLLRRQVRSALGSENDGSDGTRGEGDGERDSEKRPLFRPNPNATPR